MAVSAYQRTLPRFLRARLAFHANKVCFTLSIWGAFT